MWSVRFALSVLVAVIVALASDDSKADHCTENCRHCLLRAPRICVPNFPTGQSCSGGHCIQQGNSPDCEIRKAACHGEHWPGTSILAARARACFDDLAACPAKTIKKLPEVEIAQACVRNLARCPEEILKRIPANAAEPILAEYRASLDHQASGRWQRLPDSFVEKFSKYYPRINLAGVRFAENIDTVHGQAITFHYDIFFPSTVDINERDDAELMLHELAHTDQLNGEAESRRS
jgi:hypothetical protein